LYLESRPSVKGWESHFLGEFEERSPLTREEALKFSASIQDAMLTCDCFRGILCLVPSGPFLKLLAQHILKEGHRRVVEVGAGYGLIKIGFASTNFLDGVEYLASDIRPRNEEWIVEKLDQLEAVRKYHPSLVICSWPPLVEDPGNWPALWAKAQVREYISIGPWPQEYSRTGFNLRAGDLFYPLPGWKRTYLEELTHEAIDTYSGSSYVYSFSRRKS